jgi:SPP1 gp7 family putative phage head morphogenesis protein
MPNPVKADPTRTTTLRRVFVTRMTGRFEKFKRHILEYVLGIDVDAPVGTDRPRPTRNARFSFLSTRQQVEAFQAFLQRQTAYYILGTTQQEIENGFWKQYVEEGYRKGAGRAFDDVRRGAAVSDFYRGSRDEFLRSAFARPESIEKVKLLASRVFTDLKGVTEAVSTALSRELLDGLVQGKNPKAIAREIAKKIDTIGKVRAETIARTEIIRAHAEGQLDAFELLGIEHVGVAVEWSTALDDRVCPLCIPLEGVVLTIAEARGAIPRHPRCRCSFIPANVGESKKGQTRTKPAIKKAIDLSLAKEIPKKSKRSLAQQRTRTSWSTARKPIAQKRPKSILD